ncbi:transmembrane protein, putative, partial [Bodo saltans]
MNPMDAAEMTNYRRAILAGLSSPNAIDFPTPVVSSPYPNELGITYPCIGATEDGVAADGSADPSTMTPNIAKPSFLSWELDEPDDNPMEPVVIMGGGGGRSEMFHQTNMMMDTMQESNRQQQQRTKRIGGRSASTVNTSTSTRSTAISVFSRHPWTLRFNDHVVEEEFLVFHHSNRILPIANTFGLCGICVIGVALYSGLSNMTIGLYMAVAALWIACTISIIVLRSRMNRYEAEQTAERILLRTDEKVEASSSVLNPLGVVPAGGKSTLDMSTASLRSSLRNRSSQRSGDITAATHSLLIAKDPTRVRMRRNAQIHEYINVVVLVVNFLFAIANFAGKGTCYNARWDYEMELRGCRRAIQMDSVPLLLFITSTLMNPIRFPAFAAIYIICSIVNFASRTAPPMIALIPAYFWASVTVFGIEVLVCIIALYLWETSSRAAFEVHVQLHQRASEAARIRRHTERMVAAQIPLAAARCVTAKTPSGSSLETREAALFCWSPSSFLCAITVHNFGAWSARRGSSEIVECLRRLTNVFDGLEHVFAASSGDGTAPDAAAAPSKYPCIGDTYLLMYTPTLPDRVSRQQQQKSLEHSVGLKRSTRRTSNATIATSASGLDAPHNPNRVSAAPIPPPIDASFNNENLSISSRAYGAPTDPQQQRVLADMVLFALASLVRGTSTLKQFTQSQAAPSEDRGVPPMQLRAAIAVGFGGGVINRMTKNHLATGPVVADAMKLLACQTSTAPQTTKQRATAAGAAVQQGSLRMSAHLTSSLGIRVSGTTHNNTGLVPTNTRTVGYDTLQTMLSTHSLDKLSTSPDSHPLDPLPARRESIECAASQTLVSLVGVGSNSGSAVVARNYAGGFSNQLREHTTSVLIEAITQGHDAPNSHASSIAIVADTPNSQAGGSLLRFVREAIAEQQYQHTSIPTETDVANDQLQPTVSSEWRELDSHVINSKFVMTIATDDGPLEPFEPLTAVAESQSSGTLGNASRRPSQTPSSQPTDATQCIQTTKTTARNPLVVRIDEEDSALSRQPLTVVLDSNSSESL